MSASNIKSKAYWQAEITASVSEVTFKTPARSTYLITSRFLDIVLTFFGLIVAIPLIIIFGIAIKLDTPGPAIYQQTRVGKSGKLFTVYKLRSMVHNAERNGAQWAKKNDQRITKVGAFIRRSRIDELPQLYNILMGDMAIVCPRPERPEFTMEFQQTIPDFIERLQVKPGLTGWAQVNGGYEHTPEEKLEFDLYYISNQCIQLDVAIILKTVKVLLTGHGAR